MGDHCTKHTTNPVQIEQDQRLAHWTEPEFLTKAGFLIT